MNKRLQQGASFLQNLFFIAGIVTCIVAVMTYLDRKKEPSTPPPTEKTETIAIGGQEEPNIEEKETSEEEIQQNPIQQEENQFKSTGKIIGHYTAFANGTAIDNETNIMWARCSLGQEWDIKNLTCLGSAKEYTLMQAYKAIEKLNQNNYLGYNDWKLPNISDCNVLSSIFSKTETTCKKDCHTGFKWVKVTSNDEIEYKCKDDYQKFTINTKVFPNSEVQYWSYSAYASGYYTGQEFFKQTFNVDTGDKSAYNSYISYVRVVRSN